jgi:peptide/nickel transport system substrate-binding protein
MHKSNQENALFGKGPSKLNQQLILRRRRQMLRNKLMAVLGAIVVVSMVLAGCATPTPERIVETVVVKETVEVETVKEVEVVKTVETIVEKTVEVMVTPEVEAGTLPRNETLYFNGQQWGPVVGWNPYSSSMNNGMAVTAKDAARVIMFETLYLYNMLDGNSYPLLADGDPVWNDARTEITVKLKPAAKWSDGTPLTAEDVAYTWATNVKYSTNAGNNFKDFIDTIEVVDENTVLVKAKLDEAGNPVNPLMIVSALDGMYICQKAWTETLEARTNGDATAFLADTAEDAVYSGPYHKFFSDDTKVVYVRDDNYWGQDASMWGKLPAPKYIAHVIYKDNAAGSIALAQGEVDISQQFNSNIQVLWLNYGLPVSTYLPEAPYGIGATLPTAFYNLTSNGLDNVAIRKAIAIAVE